MGRENFTSYLIEIQRFLPPTYRNHGIYGSLLPFFPSLSTCTEEKTQVQLQEQADILPDCRANFHNRPFSYDFIFGKTETESE